MSLLPPPLLYLLPAKLVRPVRDQRVGIDSHGVTGRPHRAGVVPFLRLLLLAHKVACVERARHQVLALDPGAVIDAHLVRLALFL